MPDNPIKTKTEDDSEFNNSKSFIKYFIFVNQPTVSSKALHFDIFIIPFLHFLHSALKFVVAEWNFSVLSIISNLKCPNQSFSIFIKLENNVSCIARISRHASIFIKFVALLISFINACCVRHIQACKYIANCSIMSTVYDPLNIPFLNSPIDVCESSFEKS